MQSSLTPPWLAHDAQLQLTFKKGKQPLSHRRWRGEPVPPISEGRIQQLGNEIASRFQHMPLTWSYETCHAEWQSSITQAISYVGKAKPTMPARALAALTRLAQNDAPELLDEIVQIHGIEYATEVVIARQNVAVRYSKYHAPNIVFFHPHNVYGGIFRSGTYNPLDLRLLHQEGHGRQLLTVASRWDEPALWPALEHLLTQEPLDNYPAHIPKAPDFWQPARWRRPRLIGNDQPLSDDALEILGEMLRFTQSGHHYCGLDFVKAVRHPQSLAAFAWDLFSAWQSAGAPAKENWAFQALGIFGDEGTVRDLTQLILSWPQEGESARAASGLHIITRIDSDMSLLQLHHISQCAKSRPRRDSAERYLKQVAEERGLSDEDQQTLATEALARLKGLKKDADQAANRLLPHLEKALRLARRWTHQEFISLFVDHPLTHHLTRRLVWGWYSPDAPRRLLNTFRVAAEGGFCDCLDESITLPEEALFGIAHPLETDNETRAAFEQIFADYELLQPFRQLARRTLILPPEESTRSNLTRWQGKSATCGQLLGIHSRGWRQSSEMSFCYDIAQYRLILEITPGFAPYNIDAQTSQQFSAIRIYCGDQPVTFSRLDPQDLSEALSTIDIIFH